jgi:hypothetical protein
MMRSTETSADASGLVRRPLVSVAILATLYTCLDTKTHSAQRHRYLDWAAKTIEELEHHTKLQE